MSGVTLHLTLAEAAALLGAAVIKGPERDVPEALERAIAKLIEATEEATTRVRVRPARRTSADDLGSCILCEGPVDTKDHPAAPTRPGGRVEYACRSCFRKTFAPRALPPPEPEKFRCAGCGSAWGAGCSCESNKLSIGRGERAKARREEPWED